MSESEPTEINKPIRGGDIEVKQKPKTSPIFRPRAVVSSPGMVLDLSGCILYRYLAISRFV